MEAIKFTDFSFSYPNSERLSLQNINLTVNHGEFITLCGFSGSGKSTLLRHIKPTIAPKGNLSGSVTLFGKSTDEMSHRELSEKIGYVQQSPDNQIVTDKVWHELAFALESLGAENSLIRRRVAETASFFGIESYFEKNVSELSGGQKQLLNLASVMTTQPDLLILDEPLSQLDPISASEFISYLIKINRELGVTVIIAEHRLEEIFSASDRVAVIDCGKIISFDTPKNTGRNLKYLRSDVYDSLPSAMRIWLAAENKNASCPITAAQGKTWLEEFSKSHMLNVLYPDIEYIHKEASLSVKDIYFRYEKNGSDVIKGLSLTAHKGEFISIIGGNGVGKSTLLSLISQSEKPYRGKVDLHSNMCAILPQNPQALLSGKTVLQSLMEIFDYRYADNTERQSLISYVIKLCGIEDILDRHPFDISGGEQQKTALAKILLLKPDVILLDEPTKGLDSHYKKRLSLIIQTLTEQGVTVIMVSHDMEFCAKYSHRCVMMFNGELVCGDTPRKFFSSNSFYTTAANRIARGIIDEAVTDDEVIYCCTGIKPETSKNLDIDAKDYFESNSKKEINRNKEKKSHPKTIVSASGLLLLLLGSLIDAEVLPVDSLINLPFAVKLGLIIVPLIIFAFPAFLSSGRVEADKRGSKLSKRTIFASVMIFLAVPATIFIGTVYFDDEKYLFISLLTLAECMLPFFIIFEGKKPQARELVLISALCAIAIAGRTVFIALPQIKPVITLVIISGIALGGETGFIIGSVTMLVSNIYFGQGPWTVWQMFAAGLIGYISGVLFKKQSQNLSRIKLCVYGFIVTVFIYGGIMNFSSLILTRSPVNPATLAAFYAQGLPMDIIHAFSTAVFLFFAAKPMLEKLSHIKTKYEL